jgi:hypothetical protein
MRLNAKIAKELRGSAGYVNQSATPSKPEFPGIARMYSMPVYSTRPHLTSSYEMKEGRMTRVFRKSTSMGVVGRKGREPIIPLVMAQHTYPADHPKAGQTYMGPKLELVPVTKPIAATGEKKVYRQLKRLHKRGLLGLDSSVHRLAVAAASSPALQGGAQ